MVSLTDAPGDFVSYIVNVDSLTLTRSDGTVVQTVPVTTQVDFAQLVDLSEIVSADQIPAGRYVSAALTLDYTGATIVVDTGSGDVTVPAADILDGSGQPLTGQVTLKLSLSSDQQLVITPGTVANLALDFNLLASNTVNLTASPITVTVSPMLTASLTPDSTKQIHVRGPLVSASTSADDYIVQVRPFFDQDDTTGEVTVATTDSTQYLINGTRYTGSAGLTQLATLAAGTLTSTYGSWDRTSDTFTAIQVLVGPDVEGTGMNSLYGTVLARSGDTLTVGNGLAYQPEAMGSEAMGLSFERQETVTVGAGTTVTEVGESGPFTVADISVGQQLWISGTPGAVSSGTPTLDATAGAALLLPTSGIGLVTASASGSVTVGLQHLGGVDASALDFAGTGMTSGQDASAAAYQVSVPSSISTSSAANGTAVGFTGFVTPFGMAPPDFAASTLLNFGQAQTLFIARWAPPGAVMPFSILTGSELLLSATTLNGGTQPLIRIGGLTLDPATLSSGFELLPDMTGTEQSFAIAHVKSDSIDSFSTFNDFATALMTDLNGTTGVLQVMAEGSYANGALTADHVIVALDD
ncbi:MAG: DUF4382 domain-containing protein [Steroidobacteraceae bacterium]